MKQNLFSKWNGNQTNQYAILGMSGLGKTFISLQLKKLKTWKHYSVDYEIGKILFTENNKSFLDGFSIDNLSNLSVFLGKPGNKKKGGITFTEYVERQRLHKEAEIVATLNSCKVANSISYENFICDTSGSICEIVDPNNPNDKILNAISKNFLIICLEANKDFYETLIQRFKLSPKPMFYREEFLIELWNDYLQSVNKDETKVDPDDFILYGYKALVARRKKLFEEIGENWGIRINFNDIKKIKTGSDFVEIVRSKLKEKEVK